MTAAAGVRSPVIYRPGSAVFWVYVAAVALGAMVLLAEQGPVIRETLDANLRLAPLWISFVVFMVWLMLRFDPFRAVRPYPQALVAATAIGATASASMSILGNTAPHRWSRSRQRCCAPWWFSPSARDCSRGSRTPC